MNRTQEKTHQKLHQAKNSKFENLKKKVEKNEIYIDRTCWLDLQTHKWNKNGRLTNDEYSFRKFMQIVCKEKTVANQFDQIPETKNYLILVHPAKEQELSKQILMSKRTVIRHTSKDSELNRTSGNLLSMSDCISRIDFIIWTPLIYLYKFDYEEMYDFYSKINPFVEAKFISLICDVQQLSELSKLFAQNPKSKK